jgi:hypothetical protein
LKINALYAIILSMFGGEHSLVSLAEYGKIQRGKAAMNLDILINRLTRNGQNNDPFQRHDEDPLEGAKQNLTLFNQEIAKIIREPVSLAGGKMRLGRTSLSPAAGSAIFYTAELGRLAYSFAGAYGKLVPLTDEILDRLYNGNENRAAVESFGRPSQVEIINMAKFTMEHPHLSQLPLPQVVRRRLM